MLCAVLHLVPLEDAETADLRTSGSLQEAEGAQPNRNEGVDTAVLHFLGSLM